MMSSGLDANLIRELIRELIGSIKRPEPEPEPAHALLRLRLRSLGVRLFNQRGHGLISHQM